MQKIISVTTLAIFILFGTLFPSSTHAKNDISVYYNGEKIIFDQQPIIKNGRTLVPVRGVFESMGADIHWLPNTQTVYIKISEPFTINSSLTIGSKKITTNFRNKELDVSPMILKGRTYVPLRYISEIADAYVQWDEKTSTITITKTPIATINDYNLYGSSLYYHSFYTFRVPQHYHVMEIYKHKMTLVLLEEELKSNVFNINEERYEKRLTEGENTYLNDPERKKYIVQTYNLLRERDILSHIKNVARNSAMIDTYVKDVLEGDEEIDLYNYLFEKYKDNIQLTEGYNEFLN